MAQKNRCLGRPVPPASQRHIENQCADKGLRGNAVSFNLALNGFFADSAPCHPRPRPLMPSMAPPERAAKANNRIGIVAIWIRSHPQCCSSAAMAQQQAKSGAAGPRPKVRWFAAPRSQGEYAPIAPRAQQDCKKMSGWAKITTCSTGKLNTRRNEQHMHSTAAGLQSARFRRC
jgi:hypothetical protein